MIENFWYFENFWIYENFWYFRFYAPFFLWSLLHLKSYLSKRTFVSTWVWASIKGRNLSSLLVRRFLKPVFIRVHFVLRPVRSYILAFLAIFWYFLGPSYCALLYTLRYFTMVQYTFIDFHTLLLCFYTLLHAFTCGSR